VVSALASIVEFQALQTDFFKVMLVDTERCETSQFAAVIAYANLRPSCVLSARQQWPASRHPAFSAVRVASMFNGTKNVYHCD